MARYVETRTKIAQLAGMLGTKGLSDTEAEFVEKLFNMQAAAGKGLVNLSDKQTDWLEDLYRKNFA